MVAHGVGDRPGEDICVLGIETNQIQFFLSGGWGMEIKQEEEEEEDREHVISSLFFVRFFVRGVCKLALDISYYNISSSLKPIQALMSDQNTTETRQRR